MLKLRLPEVGHAYAYQADNEAVLPRHAGERAGAAPGQSQALGAKEMALLPSALYKPPREFVAVLNSGALS
jgi:hypothetical protein